MNLRIRKFVSQKQVDVIPTVYSAKRLKYKEIGSLNFAIIKHLKDYKKRSPVVVARVEII